MVASRGNVLPSRLQKRLVVPAREKDEAATAVGQAAHIVAHREAGPRGESSALRREELDRYPNLILLCANHHAEVDAQPETYTVEVLRSWKAEHESFVESVTSNVRVRLPWTAILQDEGRSIDGALVDDALGGRNQLESRVGLRSNPDVDGWEAAAAREWRDASVALAETPCRPPPLCRLLPRPHPARRPIGLCP